MYIINHNNKYKEDKQDNENQRKKYCSGNNNNILLYIMQYAVYCGISNTSYFESLSDDIHTYLLN